MSENVTMTVNYHTHTYRCHHASGTDRDYIEAAIARGLDTLGFSDHVPMPFAGGYESNFRVQIAEVEEYVNTLLSLREKYADRINILIGFEAEYYPALFEDMMALLGKYPYDYLILGQHYLGNELGDHSSPRGTDEKALLVRYVDQVIEGLSTGKFSYLVHPDIFKFTGDEAVYESEMERLCRACLDMDIPLEINMLGLRTGRHYPSDRFFRIAGRVGNSVLLGCDAHTPAEMALPDNIAAARALAARHGLRVIERPIMRPARG